MDRPTHVRVQKGKAEEVYGDGRINSDTQEGPTIQRIRVVRRQQGKFFVAGNDEKAYIVDPRLMATDMRKARMKGKHNKQDFLTMLGFGLVIFFATVVPSVLIVPKVEWTLMVQFSLILFFVAWWAIYFAMGSMVLRLGKFLAWLQAGLCLATLLVFSILNRDLQFRDQKRWHILYGLLVGCLTVQTCWALYFLLVVINMLHAYLIFATVYTSAVACFHLGKNNVEDDVNSTGTGTMISQAIGSDRMTKSLSYRFNQWMNDFISSLWTRRSSKRKEPPLGTTRGHSKDK